MAPSTLRLDRAAATAQPSPMTAAVSPAQDLADRYRRVRARTEALAEPLAPEDCVVQTMQDVSPTKWHLAHVTWFFETFVLRPPSRGLPSRSTPATLSSSTPTTCRPGPVTPATSAGTSPGPPSSEVYAYRACGRQRACSACSRTARHPPTCSLPLVELGLNHEQQHQELILTDIKHVFSVNPLRPAYRELAPAPGAERAGARLARRSTRGLYEIGHDGRWILPSTTSSPRHRALSRAVRAGRPARHQRRVPGVHG